jgi:hypothetical protein
VRRRIAIGLAVAVIVACAAWWNTGAMDSGLLHVGLNRNECVQNGAGNWFCGDAAERVQREAEKAETPKRHARATPAKPAFMPCDNQDTWETVLRVRPKRCSVYSGTNGVGASSMAEGAHVVSLRWRSWGGTKAKASGLIKGQKIGDPDRPATIVLKGESCDEFVVYTKMTMITDEGAYPIRLDGDCDHLSASPAREPVQTPDDNSADEAKAAAEEAQKALDEQLDQQCKYLHEDADFGGLYRGEAEERAGRRYSELGCSQR